MEIPRLRPKGDFMVVQADNLRRAQSGEHHLTKLVEQAGPMFARNQVNQR